MLRCAFVSVMPRASGLTWMSNLSHQLKQVMHPKALVRPASALHGVLNFLGTKQNEISFYVRNEKNIIKLKNNKRINNI